MEGDREFFFKIRFRSLQGNFAGLARVCQELKDGPPSRRLGNLETLLNELDRHRSLWKGNPELIKAVLALLSPPPVMDSLSHGRQKKFVIKLAFDALFAKGTEPLGLQLVKSYARSFSRKELGYLASYLGNDMEGIDFFSKLEENPAEAENIDLGEDLGKKPVNESERLEKNIKFLLNAGQRQKALRMALELKDVNPEHPLLETFFPPEPPRKKFPGRIIVDGLLKEIARYSSPDRRPKDSAERAFRKTVLSLPPGKTRAKPSRPRLRFQRPRVAGGFPGPFKARRKNASAPPAGEMPVPAGGNPEPRQPAPPGPPDHRTCSREPAPPGPGKGRIPLPERGNPAGHPMPPGRPGDIQPGPPPGARFQAGRRQDLQT